MTRPEDALEKTPPAGATGPALPANYHEVLTSLADLVRTSQLRAALAVNRELVGLYLQIGKTLAEQQVSAGWGDGVVDRLATDLRSKFPSVRGFSRANLFAMRQVHEAWRDADPIVQQAAGQIPWGHHTYLVSKVKDPSARGFYARAAFEHGWSRAVLTVQVETRLHERQGRAVNNFDRTLPPPQSDLARAVLKDPYVFDFLEAADKMHERDIEQQLLEHVQRFLLELGVGFAFLGRQFHMQVGESDFFVDLLFYHVKLHCYVIVELKAGPFKPEFAGQLNFYLQAVDAQVKQPDDKPSIGLLLCKGRDRVVVEYALRGMEKPIGVADWETGLSAALPQELKGKLPTTEQIEAELTGSLPPQPAIRSDG